MKSPMFAVVAWLLLATAGAAAADATDAAASSLSMDFLIQDVCVDATTGAVLPRGDPAACAQHRDLRVGETLPYHKHDFDTSTGVLYQLCDAFPLPHADGTVRVVHSLDFANHGAAVDNLTFVQFDHNLDGYNANQASTAFASIVGTADPSCLSQPCPEYFVAPAGNHTGNANQSCNLLDAWGLWDRAWLARAVAAPPAPTPAGSHLFRLNIQRATPPSSGTCPPFYNDAFTEFALLRNYTFLSGKSLTTVRQQHWAGTTFAGALSGVRRRGRGVPGRARAGVGERGRAAVVRRPVLGGWRRGRRAGVAGAAAARRRRDRRARARAHARRGGGRRRPRPAAAGARRGHARRGRRRAHAALAVRGAQGGRHVLPRQCVFVDHPRRRRRLAVIDFFVL